MYVVGNSPAAKSASPTTPPAPNPCPEICINAFGESANTGGLLIGNPVTPFVGLMNGATTVSVKVTEPSPVELAVTVTVPAVWPNCTVAVAVPSPALATVGRVEIVAEPE